MSSQQDLDILRKLFQRDYPEAFAIFNLDNLEKDYLINQFKEQAFKARINQYLTGQTHAGKTSFNNNFLMKKMPSTGNQDCTDFVAFFDLKGNLRSFDTPGVNSLYDYDNINRVALCLPQKPKASRAAKKAKELPFNKEPGTPYQESDVFMTKDYTPCIDDPKAEPIEMGYEVGQWQNEPKVKPDIIFYIVAPHQLYLNEDREYYETLLDRWGDIVIPVLNIHRNPDGTIKPTPQNIQNARQGITEIYQAVFNTDEEPPIFEMNCLEGDGIAQLTEYVCQILPPEKVGNFGNVIKDDLKKYAQKQRQENYYHNLAIISGLLSRTTVKDFDGRSSLLHTTASALMFYGMRTFKSAEALDIDSSSINQEADKIKQQKAQEKFKYTNIERDKEIKKDVPVYGEIKTSKQVVVPKMKERKTRGFLWIPKTELYEDNEVVTLTDTSYGVVDYKSEVIDTVKEVIGQSKESIGYEYNKGGYEAISFLLSIGLAVELFSDAENISSFNGCIEQAKLIVERKLQPIKSKIEQLVNSDTGEKNLIVLLDQMLLG
ncbi:hypothetical protein [Pseudanabaena sp. ABRG5-3]|uniref:hypothetical protein n=1 Tax=Pseudanabaena sp. ABRG5-3 TaxID=685565 RepID=UPI000DC71CE2|nr:hypothetical protein [Pseudanabaena sp. ABRG5-3]BBC25586.1 hypothetical protein ABRG53_3329 [Pseudanabaena sp. ABRG5-3]